MLARPALGLADVYNLLPARVIEQNQRGINAARFADALEVSYDEGGRQLASHILVSRPNVRASVASFFLSLAFLAVFPRDSTCVVTYCRPSVTSGCVRSMHRKKNQV